MFKAQKDVLCVLTVLLDGHLERHVLLLQFLVGLLKVADVIDGFP